MKRNATLRAKLPPPRPVKTIGDGYTPRPRVAPAAANDAEQLVTPVPKLNYLQHQGYMDTVRRMACAHCGRRGPSQFCHSDENKGMGYRTDCRNGWPGCADGPGRVGCHTMVGSTGMFTRDQRRALERHLAAKTRAAIIAAGRWPADLPMLEGDE